MQLVPLPYSYTGSYRRCEYDLRDRPHNTGRVRWWSGLIICLLLLPFSLMGGTTGKVVGQVTDAVTGEPLYGANVLLEGTNLGAATGEDGNYIILMVPPGTYAIRASMIGYNDFRIERVRVRIDLTTTIDIQAEPGVVGLREVVVTAETPIVQADVTYSQANISSEEISDLPVEEFEDILAIQAGVVVDAGGALHIRGGRSNEIAYMIDGVSVTDPMSQGMAVEIENNAIQELQLISGTFNAEYGQAMSGVVNIVTKDGSYSDYHGSISLNAGDYWSRDTSVFDAPVAEFDPLSLGDVQASFSGPLPLLKGLGSFFLSGRYVDDEGYLYGRRYFLPQSHRYDADLLEWVPDPEKMGDSLFVPMNKSSQGSWQAKVSLRPTSRLKLSLNILDSNTRYRTYAHKYKWNPDGDYQRFRTNQSIIAKVEQGLSASTFLILSYALAERKYWYYVYSDPFDALRYNVDPQVFNQARGYRFYIGGIRMDHSRTESETQTAKIELTSQLNPLHQVQLGIEGKAIYLSRKLFTILYNEKTRYLPQVDSVGINYDLYNRRPQQYSAYIQDKLEYSDLVINIGLRYDHFVPDGVVLNDPSDPNYLEPMKPVNQYVDDNGDGQISSDETTPKSDAARLEYWYKKPTVKSQLSPRVALAFPISDRGVLHFSYGHFFQIPPNSYLYANPDFEVTSGGYRFMGNAELEAERTTMYEVGIKQQIGMDIGLNVTGFYKDIRNLLGTKIIDTFIGDTRYTQYINREYGNVKGITVALFRRPTGFLSGRVDYTYSVSEGSASDPAAAYYDEQNGNEAEKQLVPLNWDQRHTLNATVTFRSTKGHSLSLIGNYGSGLPYTPELAGTRLYFENSERKPAQYNVDLRAYWAIKLLGLDLSLHLNVYNLLDRRNEELVFDSTGRANYSLDALLEPQDQGYNTLGQYIVRPDYYSPPRQIKIGLTAKF
ncbi:MAG: TonB-dependent receptor [Fidelibacterota bacterium]|nr:MAG: TonB-dependent receptor [Candidatus Neomarinimicrobiota bacterium]